MFSEVWGAPGAMELSDQENLEYGKALISAVAGDGHVARAEREWILGYLQAGGHSEETIAALSGYDGEDGVDGLFESGTQSIAQRVCVCDAIRACGADGDLASEELEKVHAIADRLGVPPEVVDEFVDIYRQEQELKSRRAALAFPAAWRCSSRAAGAPAAAGAPGVPRIGC